jgi:hypothetical protein
LKAGRSEASKTLYNRFIRWSRLGSVYQNFAKAIQVQDGNPDDGRNPFKGSQDSGELPITR